jgi:hypothetical protein
LSSSTSLASSQSSQPARVRMRLRRDAAPAPRHMDWSTRVTPGAVTKSVEL